MTDDRYAGRSSQSSARSNNPRNGGRRGYGAPTSRNVPPAYDQYATSSYAPDNYRFLSVKRSRFPRFALLAVAAVVAVVIVGGVAWGIAGGQILANPDKDAAVETAAALATQYDYDGAIDTLNAYASEHNDDSLAETIEDYEAQRAALVPVDNDEITHVFYHSLVKDPSLAFANPDDELTAGFAQWMTTIDEYNAITQQMYDRGYVLVGLDDMYTETVDEDGTVHFEPKEILLPPDKKPFVLSLDDLSYYHSYDNRGIASKLVLDENGNVICEYIEQDGTVTYGAFDVVPLLEEFIAAHPDFAYKNARGTIALTGYNGIFGYRTDPAYEAGDPENLADDQIAWLEDHPDFDYDAECDQAKAVADALKAKGWTMASHTWGHMNISTIKLDSLKRDTQRWKESVEPLVGQTEKIIFAHGVDMSPTGVYNDDNEKYSFLKSQGFNVFCIVDGSKPYTLDITDAYVHQGRRNLDGYRMYHDLMTESVENRLTGDLFTVEEVIDPARPLDAKLYDLG